MCKFYNAFIAQTNWLLTTIAIIKPECPPAGLPPMVECTSCHQCANSQSEYDAINGSHSSFTRCGEFSQGSGGGRTCKDVIDAFVSERADFDGLCKGHCGPIVRHGCDEFHWGRTEEPNGNGFYHYTLNWGNCNKGACDSYCDAAEPGIGSECFASGIDTPGKSRIFSLKNYIGILSRLATIPNTAISCHAYLLFIAHRMQQ